MYSYFRTRQNIKLNKNRIHLGGIDVETAKLVCDSVITEAEYNHLYYKSRVLLMTLVLFDVEAGIPPTLNNENKKNKFIGYSDFKIQLTDVIKCGGEEIVLEDLKIKLEIFIDENTPNYTISIYQQPNTSYRLYVNTQNIIHEVIDELRNEKSLELYGIPILENTNLEQIKMIEELFPESILEAENKDVLIYM